MIKTTKVNPHVKSANIKANVPPTQKEIIKQKPPQVKTNVYDIPGFPEPDNKDTAIFNDPADLLDLSEDIQDKIKNNMTANIQAEHVENDSEGGGDLTDNSRRLTRLLVAAKSHMEVQDVLSAAHKDKMELIKAAAFGDEKAKAIIRKIDKVIKRGHRKMRDLSKEIQLLQRQQRAEKKEQEQIVRQLREELKRAQLEREQRERKYLHENDEDDDDENAPMLSGPSMAATEAKIRALAEAKAALTAVGSSSSSSEAASFNNTGMSADIGGGEAAIAGEAGVDEVA